jgi:glycosyltransferase involved in cell wall biosynthesis
VTGYNRVYEPPEMVNFEYRGVRLVNLPTTRRKGAEALLHSFKATLHILRYNTGDVVHIQNGGNSPWALVLRLFGKRVFIGEDGAEWNRSKWPWYGRLYLGLMKYLTAYAPNGVIFDNEFVRDWFEQRFRRRYYFIPFGSEPPTDEPPSNILEKLGLEAKEYFLFVGRFIPDKGLQYLIPAFEQLATDKKLILVGGTTDGSEFVKSLRSTSDPRILFPGYVYGEDVHALMRGAYAYVQPSDIEGLSPVILENMGLETPVICSDIRENIYVVGDTALTFQKSDTVDLTRILRYALDNPDALIQNAERARKRAMDMFSWESVTTQHEELFFAKEQS